MRARMLRGLFWGLGGLTLASVLLTGGLMGFVLYEIYFGDTVYLQKTAIVDRIAQETTIYYADGKTRLGSLFTGAHRKYLPLSDVPKNVVNAIVSAEDKNFFAHQGVDFLATAEAAFEGLRHGNFRRAGSSITQQTVKIIFDHWEHSFRRKFWEAIAAFQMERLYSKQQILEFYLNQFYVSGNGRGIGIAAKYYFNKDAKDLSLVEAAFLAGSVKNPAKYNPFTKTSHEARFKAEEDAKARKNYVLRRMLEQGYISRDQFNANVGLPVPFNKGDFQSSDIALVDLVRAQLDNPEILYALGMDSVDDFNAAGLNVYTTLDADIQDEAQQAVRRNLARLDTTLHGFQPEPPQKFRPLRDLQVDDFCYARVDEIVREPHKAYLRISAGVPHGIVTASSLREYARWLSRGDGQGEDTDLARLVVSIRPGDIIYVEASAYNPQTHQGTFTLQKRPRLNGGLIAIEDGEVRAVVPGFDMSGYNRAMDAVRQPGSVFKTLTFYAASQLGWSILDRLNNARQVFSYQGQLYFPRPAHESPYDDVSLLWTGVESENIASVYLTAHLLDKLTFSQFKDVLATLGLMPEPHEGADHFHQRLAKVLGGWPSDDGIKQHLLARVIEDMAPELIFSGQQDLLKDLRGLWWGNGYAAEIKRLEASHDGSQDRGLHAALVLNNYLRMHELEVGLRDDWIRLTKASASGHAAALQTDPTLRPLWKHFAVQGPRSSHLARLAYFGADTGDFAAAERLNRGWRELTASDVEGIWGAGAAITANSVDQVQLGGYLPLRILSKIDSQIAARLAAVHADDDPYQLERYFNHHDLRIAIGLNYLVALCHAMGVQSDVEPVLSFPLGTNAVSLGEVAKIYQTVLSGKTYRFYQEGPANQLNFISRIEDSQGHLLYEPRKKEVQLATANFSLPVLTILRNVMTFGTGRLANRELNFPWRAVASRETSGAARADVSLGGPPLVRYPVLGKTGTTNDFTTGSFAGFLPYPSDDSAGLDAKHSYVVATYAGYDSNEPMRRGVFKGYGGDTALPAWLDFARGVIKRKGFQRKLSRALDRDGGLSLHLGEASEAVSVDLVNGEVLSSKALETPNDMAADQNTAGASKALSETGGADLPASHRAVGVLVDGSVRSGIFQPERKVKPFTLPVPKRDHEDAPTD